MTNKRKQKMRTGGLVAGLHVALILAVVGAQPSMAKDPYDKLVSMAKAEMGKVGGKIRMSLDWPGRDTKKILPAFKKAFPFVKSIKYKRERGIGPFGRFLISWKQGQNPPYDIMHVAGEMQKQYRDAGAFIKPIFDYRELNKSRPSGSPEISDLAYSPDGWYLSSAGLVRGNAYNAKLVPKGKEPKTWDACTNSMWKGRVLIDSRNKLHAFQYDTKQRKRHIQWLKDMVKNKVVIVQGQGSIAQKVAAGEYPIACAMNYHTTQRMIDRGAKNLRFTVADVIPLELGTRLYINKWSVMPATTQLFAFWLATAGQDMLDKTAYRGFPTNPTNRNYPGSRGKHISICGPDCVKQWGKINAEYQKILNIPATKKKRRKKKK